jgi:hypothetical protein
MRVANHWLQQCLVLQFAVDIAIAVASTPDEQPQIPAPSELLDEFNALVELQEACFIAVNQLQKCNA